MKSKTIIAIVAGVLVLIALAALNNRPQTLQASAAQEPPPAVAPAVEPEPEPLVCLDCHRMANVNTNEGVFASQTFCLDCHKDKTCIRQADSAQVSLQVIPETFAENQPRHRFVACVDCHSDVARTPHKTMAGAQCRACHPLHGEATAHDPHTRVACQACHFKSKFVALDPVTGSVALAHKDLDRKPVSLADHSLADMDGEKSCEKCHHAGNTAHAPASVLPSKSFMCILCHTAPLSMGHPVFGVAFFIFLLGVLLTLRFWYQGKVQGEETSLTRKISLSSESIWSTLFSRQVFALVKILILDIVLQRRILKESVRRWSMHSLIFTAILLRMMLGLVTAIGFWLNPEGEWMLALMDKNNGFTAFANDLLGLLILIGILWAVIQRFVIKPAHVTTEIQDNMALSFIGLLVLLGFVLEGARILATGIPADLAAASFIGYPLSRIFSVAGLDWSAVYPYLWYAHALVGAALVAYLPFGKMRHVFNTPLTYFLEQVSGVKNEKRV
ncbi:MAG: respiratory nitrate reductase subunit gamma [Pseudomonadota bacterium]